MSWQISPALADPGQSGTGAGLLRASGLHLARAPCRISLGIGDQLRESVPQGFCARLVEDFRAVGIRQGSLDSRVWPAVKTRASLAESAGDQR